MTYTSTEPYNPWAFMYPQKEDEAQKKKRSYVTNYVKEGDSPDTSLPQVATGGVVPFVIGREIIRNPDIIWYGNLKPIYTTKTVQTTTTDADGNETITNTVTSTFDHNVIDVQFCVGLGPGMKLRTILVDNVAIWTGSIGPARTDAAIVGSAALQNFTFAGGNFDQAIDPYLDALIVESLSGYRGFAYVICKAMDVGNLSNISFEVERFPDVLALGTKNKIGEDINPVSAMAEIITSTWGGAGQDPTRLGTSFTTVANRLYDELNGASILNRTTASANNLNEILLNQMDGILYEDHDTGKLELNVFRKDQDNSESVRLFDKDIIRVNSMDKGSWQQTPSTLKLKYVDRVAGYRDIPLVARNLAVSSKIPKSTMEMSFPAVRNGTLASKILAREGANNGSPIQVVDITTNRKTRGCNPGDVIFITKPSYKYYSVPAIVMKRRTQPLQDNTVTLTCKVILYPNNNLLFSAPETGFFVPLDPNPHPPTAIKVISAPVTYRITPPQSGFSSELTTDAALFLASAYNAAQLAVGSYRKVGTEYVRFYTGATAADGTGENLDIQYPVVGKLDVAINKYDHWDGTAMGDISIRDLSVSKTAIETITASITTGGPQNGFIFIGDEIFVIDKSRNAGTVFLYTPEDNTLVITGAYRAMFDTVAQAHAANSDVYVLTSQQVYKGAVGFTVGVAPDLKFTGIANPKGVKTESPISTALNETSWVPTDRAIRPLRPHDTKINAARGTSSPTALVRSSTPTISWKIRSRVFQPYGTIRYARTQTEPDEIGEVRGSAHIVYRVFIIDSAAVSWDCGTTSGTADVNSKVITVPAGAAVGNGELYVQAEFDQGNGVRTSLYQDRLPVVLS